MKRRTIILIALATAAVAANPPGGVPAIGQKMKQNAEALQQYSHQRRTDIKIKGQSRGARVDLVRYVDGKMETVPLEGPPRQAEQGRNRPLRGMIIQKKKEEMKEDVERLTSLLHRYVSPGSDSLHTVFEKAEISRTGPEPEAAIQVVAKGIVKPSDSVTLTWSVVNHRPERIEVHTDLDGKPVSATVDYASLPDGPFYAARTVVSAPKKDISITIDTYDYTHGGNAN